MIDKNVLFLLIGAAAIITVGVYFALKYHFEAEDFEDLSRKMF